MLLYVVGTVGEFVWNEGGVVPATCALHHDCDFFLMWLTFLFVQLAGSFDGRLG